jgi:hypothetical protein
VVPFSSPGLHQNLLSSTVARKYDLNGDGKSDLVWRKASTGQVSAWLRNGTSMVSSTALLAAGNSAWNVAAVEDLNGDGKSDILWRNAGDGTVTAWLMNGTAMSSTATLAGAGNTAWDVANK